MGGLLSVVEALFVSLPDGQLGAFNRFALGVGHSA